MLYYGLTFLFTFTANYSQIKFGRAVKNVFDLLIYSLITGSMASVFFLITAGFRINVNLPTVIYSLVFAVIVVASHFSRLLLFRSTDISTATVLTNTLNLILTFATGMIFLSEKAGFYEILRCVVMIAASVLLYFPVEKGKSVKKQFRSNGILLSFVTAAISVMASVVANSFSKDPRVTDSDSFFFLTNIFVVALMLIAIVITKKGKLSLLFRELKNFSVKGYILTALSTISSNVNSLLQILIFASGDGITLYTPISGALGLIAAGVVAVLEKEKPKVIPLILACASLFIGLL